jgi:chromosomal replication initiator protein
MNCNPCLTDAIPEKAKTQEREIDNTIEIICKIMKVPITDLYSKKRDRVTADCRNLIFYVLRNYYNLKFSYIGKMFGRDHTTVMAGIRSYNNLYATDPTFRNRVDTISPVNHTHEHQ